MPASALPRDLARARADWLRGDPRAWSRYAACLAQLKHAADEAPRRPRRPGRTVPARRARA